MYLVGGISQGLLTSITVINTGIITFISLTSDCMTQSTRQPSGDVPDERAAHTAVLWGQHIVVFGGTSGEKYYNSVYALNTG